MFRKPSILIFISLSLSLISNQTLASSDQKMKRLIEQVEEKVIKWRRDFHQYPELSNREFRTAEKVAKHLKSLGMEVKTGVAHTGVIGILKGDLPGKVVALRADMDALPVTERVKLPFASKVTTEYANQKVGVMHACGHDAHTAILMGVAQMLNSTEGLPSGEIRLLFQPSEEKWDKELKSGATRMIDDSALEDLDAVIALHVSSQLKSGQVSIGEGHMLAAVDSFYATIKGEGCHGASPHTGVDPIWIQAQIVNAIQGIRARRLNPIEPSVITIGAIHGGTATNVIPHEVKMMGTIRSYSEEVRDQQHAELENAFALAKALGGDYELTIERGYPALYNDPDVAELIRTVGIEALGEDQLPEAEPGMGAEDFAYMTQKAPGAMFFLGAKLDEVNRPHHSPIFDIDEKALHIGAAVLAETAVRLLKDKA